MTPQEINIAIAEACGIKIPSLKAIQSRCPGWTNEVCEAERIKLAPNYYSDLNTRAEMLGVIIESGKMKQFSNRFAGIWDALSIPQPEFCERFLRTVRKWKE